MSFGGGSFIAQNKVLPGVYVNIDQQARVSSALSERGVAALGLEMDWGPDGSVFYVEAADLRKNAAALFGYNYSAPEMAGLRDLFLHLTGCYFYRLNSGAAAGNELCQAKYSGTRGNALQIAVEETDGGFVVTTLLDGREVDVQQAASAAELADNDYVCWKAEAELAAAAALPLSGGSNKESVGAEDHQAMLTLLEEYQFNVLGCLSTDSTVQALYAAYTQEQREECGAKFQTVLYRYAADYEGVISLENSVAAEGFPESALVYWLVGAEAGCAVNATLTNAVYDGGFAPQAISGQTALKEALLAGKLVLHKVGNELRVLEDINTLVNHADAQGEDMRFNQTVRVLDQIVLDVAAIFYDRYLGIVPNDNAGRISLWNDIVTYHRQLLALRAIEQFDPADIVVEQGEDRKAVVVSEYLKVTNAMSQLYLTVTFE